MAPVPAPGTVAGRRQAERECSLRWRGRGAGSGALLLGNCAEMAMGVTAYSNHAMPLQWKTSRLSSMVLPQRQWAAAGRAAAALHPWCLPARHRALSPNPPSDSMPSAAAEAVRRASSRQVRAAREALTSHISANAPPQSLRGCGVDKQGNRQPRRLTALPAPPAPRAGSMQARRRKRWAVTLRPTSSYCPCFGQSDARPPNGPRAVNAFLEFAG